MKIKNGQPASWFEGSGKRLLRRPKLSTRKFSAWKKKTEANYKYIKPKSECYVSELRLEVATSHMQCRSIIA
jgi:hypothetical protein